MNIKTIFMRNFQNYIQTKHKLHINFTFVQKNNLASVQFQSHLYGTYVHNKILVSTLLWHCKVIG